MYKLCINTIKSIFFISFSISLAYFPHICCSFVHIFPISVVNGPIKVCIDDRYEDIYNRMGGKNGQIDKIYILFSILLPISFPNYVGRGYKRRCRRSEHIFVIDLKIPRICWKEEMGNKMAREMEWGKYAKNYAKGNIQML